jgi:hypothetical protein
MLDVRGRRDGVHQVAVHVLTTAARRELTGALELIAERDGIDRRAALAETDQRVEDPAVPFAVEHADGDQFHGAHERSLVLDARAEHRNLGALVVRRHASRRVIWRRREVVRRGAHAGTACAAACMRFTSSRSAK